jgi:hypothetical protein
MMNKNMSSIQHCTTNHLIAIITKALSNDGKVLSDNIKSKKPRLQNDDARQTTTHLTKCIHDDSSSTTLKLNY